MDIAQRYINVISLFQTTWFLPRHVIDKGVAIFERLGTPEYSVRRIEFYEGRTIEPEMALPGNRFNRNSDDSRTRLLGSLGVHRTPNGTAVVPVYGVLAKRMSDFDMSERGTSSDMLADAFDILAGIDEARGVVLDVSSPGGSVLGVEGAAQALDNLRQKKPVTAIANEVMASGAYYIGSHVDQLYVTPTSYIGSIGVYTTRVDATKFYENKGIKVDVISRGEFKTDRHPETEMSPEERARIQAEVDTYYDLFIDAVVRGRNISRAEALSLGDGSLEIGEKAVTRGLADAVADLNWVASAMDQQVEKRTFAIAAQVNTSKTMPIFGKGKQNESVEIEKPSDEEVEVAANEVETESEIAAREAAIAEDEKRIAERERALVVREVKADFDDLVKSGQVLPNQRAYLENLALNLRLNPFQVSVPVAEAEEDDVHDAYESLMSALMVGAPQVEYSEIVKNGDEPPKTDFEDSQNMARVMVKVMEKENLTSDEAFVFIKEKGIPEYAVENKPE